MYFANSNMSVFVI